jgi:hypothetical protein
MKKLIIKTVLFVFCSLYGMFVFAQTQTPASYVFNPDGSVTVVGKKVFIYKSLSSDLSPSNIAMSVGDLLSMNPTLTSGIKVSNIASPFIHNSPIASNSSIIGDGVKLKVNFYNLAENKKLKPIYKVFATTNNPLHYQEGFWGTSLQSSNLHAKHSNDIRKLVFDNRPYKPIYDYESPNPSFQSYSHSSIYPVYIEVVVQNATVHSFKIPGVGVFTPADLFHNSTRFNSHLTQIKDVFENPQHYDYSIVAAHRGYWAEPDVPENTIAAFHRAYEIGADLIEVDVRLTSDSIPVACHDEYLYRSYHVSALALMNNVAEDHLTIGMISKVEFKGLSTKENTDINPNTLEEILDEFDHHLISLDIKDTHAVWSSSFKKCLLLAQSKNVLQNMIIKGDSKKTASRINSLFGDVNTIINDTSKSIDFTKFYFTPVMYGKYNSDGTPLDPNSNTVHNAWKTLWENGSVKAVECHFKVENDPLVHYVDLLHTSNRRVGIYNFYADKPTGVYTMEADGSLHVRAYTPNIDYVSISKPDPLTDNRGYLDWCMEIGHPNYFIYDRPVMLINMLEALAMRNLISKAP